LSTINIYSQCSRY